MDVSLRHTNVKGYFGSCHDGEPKFWTYEEEYLADEMGLGKTVQLQLIATMLGNPKPRTLIVVPKSIITQWVEEIDQIRTQS
jgi:hypothetical protein